MASYKMELDSRVPVLAGETWRDVRTYGKTVAAHILTVTAKDKEKLDA